MKFKLGRFRWTSHIENRRLAALMGLALIALVAGIALIVSIAHLPAPAVKPVPPEQSALNFARMDSSKQSQILAEQAMLFDPTPLFLPTQYNVSQVDVAAISHREPGENFPVFPANLVYVEFNFSIAFSDPVKALSLPMEALNFSRAETPYAPFGRAEVAQNALSTRMACVEIVRAQTGHTMLSLPIATPVQPTPVSGNIAPISINDTPPLPTTLPPALASGDWMPLEFLMAIDNAGIVGLPTLVQGSGSPLVDTFFSDYLIQKLHIDSMRALTTGFYIVRIGP